MERSSCCILSYARTPTTGRPLSSLAIGVSPMDQKVRRGIAQPASCVPCELGVQVNHDETQGQGLREREGELTARYTTH